MSSFLKLVYELVGQIVYNVVNWVVSFVMGFVKIFFTGWIEYASIFFSYFKGLNFLGKILAILLVVILIAIPVLIIYFVIKRIKLRRDLNSGKDDNATLYREIGMLNKQVLDLIDEKNKILALKVNATGMEGVQYAGGSALLGEDGEPIVVSGGGASVISGGAAPVISGGATAGVTQTTTTTVATAGEGGVAAVSAGGVTAAAGTPVAAPVAAASAAPVAGAAAAPVAAAGEGAALAPVAGAVAPVAAGNMNATIVKEPDNPFDPTVIRFPKLSLVDDRYAEYERPEFDETITLEEFAEKYRRFAASQLKLYYTPEIIRRFIAGMASSKILILEGISGTGKTSLPYSFSRFLDNPATIVSVQPSFRDRTEVIGYFNEFSKRFNETEFLRALYEANYREDPNFIVLDEMNLARIEYYFAEMLSILEMPSHDEWVLDLVPTKWPKDPLKLDDGKIHVTDNMWFVGTANNDDSTFTITDKVYDRAMPIEINERADAFTCEDQPAVHVSNDHLMILFDRARHDHPISEETIEKLNNLDQYLQTRFKLAFGNRITKQMHDFIPVYVACGGTETGGMDYIIARKVLKKFESMNVMFVRDEIKGLILYIEKTFGKKEMPDSISYLTRIQNLY